MKWLQLLLFCVLPFFSAEGIEDDEYKFLTFDYCWKSSTNMALGNQSVDWPKLKNVDPDAARWVAYFWFTKCHMEFHGYWSSVVDQLKSKASSDIEANPKLASDKRAQDKMIDGVKTSRAKEELLMLQCFLYDHAPEINAMIATRLELANNGQSSTLKKEPDVSNEDIEKRNRELQKMRDDYFKEQEPDLPKAIKNP